MSSRSAKLLNVPLQVIAGATTNATGYEPVLNSTHGGAALLLGLAPEFAQHYVFARPNPGAASVSGQLDEREHDLLVTTRAWRRVQMRQDRR